MSTVASLRSCSRSEYRPRCFGSENSLRVSVGRAAGVCGSVSRLSKPLCVDAGAEGMQDSRYVGVFPGSAPQRLHHQPCLQLGGPSGPERLPSAGRAGAQAEEGERRRRQDGMNLPFIFAAIVIARSLDGDQNCANKQ